VNTDTREIRDVKDISEEEQKSGKWIPVRRKYIEKQPITDEDFIRIKLAEERRLRRAAKKHLL